MNNKIREEMEKIEIPLELTHRIEVGVEQAAMEKNSISFQKKKWSIKKKVFSVGFVAVALIGLFISSTTVSPVMAKVAAKIPYFNEMMNKEDISTRLHEKLKNHDDYIESITLTKHPKEITISLKDAEDYSKIKTQVKNEAGKFLQSTEYNEFRVKVSKYDEEHIKELNKQINEDLKEPIDMSPVLTDVNSALRDHGFDTRFNLYSYDFDPISITMEIPDTEKRTDEIKTIVSKVAKSHGIEDIVIHFSTFNYKKKEQYARWSPIITTIDDSMITTKEYSIKSFGFSNKKIMTLYIQINVSASNPKAKAWTKKIEEDIHQYISSNEVQNITKGEPYKIEITSKDDQKLN
jgi:hypothetical protein